MSTVGSPSMKRSCTLTLCQWMSHGFHRVLLLFSRLNRFIHSPVYNTRKFEWRKCNFLFEHHKRHNMILSLCVIFLSCYNRYVLNFVNLAPLWIWWVLFHHATMSLWVRNFLSSAFRGSKCFCHGYLVVSWWIYKWGKFINKCIILHQLMQNKLNLRTSFPILR